MDSYNVNSSWGASVRPLRERIGSAAVAPISGVQGTGVPAAKAYAHLGFQAIGQAPATTVMTAGAVRNDDIRVPPRGRPL